MIDLQEDFLQEDKLFGCHLQFGFFVIIARNFIFTKLAAFLNYGI